MGYPWCVMLTPKVPGKSKGAILEAASWARGSKISYGFLDGDAGLHDRVATVAQEWIDRSSADLILERRNDPGDAHVRISFRYSGSWSLLGTFALDNKERAQPTMNFGWLTPASSDVEVREVVLHEFGHALGFIHEHQNPSGGMQWNREMVVEELSGPPNSWSVEEIEHNVLDHYDRRELLGTPFDEKSIMLYPFPAEWTLNGFTAANNTDLSEMDIQLAQRVYS